MKFTVVASQTYYEYCIMENFWNFFFHHYKNDMYLFLFNVPNSLMQFLHLVVGSKKASEICRFLN